MIMALLLRNSTNQTTVTIFNFINGGNNMRTYEFSFKNADLDKLAEENPEVSKFVEEYVNDGFSESDGINTVWTVEIADDKFSEAIEAMKTIGTVRIVRLMKKATRR